MKKQQLLLFHPTLYHVFIAIYKKFQKLYGLGVERINDVPICVASVKFI